MKINPRDIIIVGLCIWIVCLHECAKPCELPDPEIITKVDTIKIEVKGEKEYIPTYISVPGKPSKEYLPAKDCDSLRKQYTELVDDYFNMNIYKDTTQVEKDGKNYGHLIIIDTVQKNTIKKRKFDWNIFIPEITKETTIIQPAPKKTEWYYGGSLNGNQNMLFSIQPSILIKTKKDIIYQPSVQIPLNGEKVIYGMGAYYKF